MCEFGVIVLYIWGVSITIFIGIMIVLRRREERTANEEQFKPTCCDLILAVDAYAAVILTAELCLAVLGMLGGAMGLFWPALYILAAAAVFALREMRRGRYYARQFPRTEEINLNLRNERYREIGIVSAKWRKGTQAYFYLSERVLHEEERASIGRYGAADLLFTPLCERSAEVPELAALVSMYDERKRPAVWKAADGMHSMNEETFARAAKKAYTSAVAGNVGFFSLIPATVVAIAAWVGRVSGSVSLVVSSFCLTFAVWGLLKK